MIINYDYSTDYDEIAAALREAWEVFQTESRPKPVGETNERRRIRMALQARYEAAHAAASFLEEEGVDPGPFVQMQAIALDAHTRALARDAGDWAQLEKKSYRAKAKEFGLSAEDLELGLLVNLVEKASPGSVSDAAMRNFDDDFAWTWDERRNRVHSEAAMIVAQNGEAGRPAAPPEDSEPRPSKLTVVT